MTNSKGRHFPEPRTAAGNQHESLDMKNTHRRGFLKQTAAASAAVAFPGICAAKLYAAVAGANERIRLAVVGLKGRGMVHLDEFSAFPNV